MIYVRVRGKNGRSRGVYRFIAKVPGNLSLIAGGSGSPFTVKDECIEEVGGIAHLKPQKLPRITSLQSKEEAVRQKLRRFSFIIPVEEVSVRGHYTLDECIGFFIRTKGWISIADIEYMLPYLTRGEITEYIMGALVQVSAVELDFPEPAKHRRPTYTLSQIDDLCPRTQEYHPCVPENTFAMLAIVRDVYTKVDYVDGLAVPDEENIENKE